MAETNTTNFEILYDTYCPMLYDIALQITSTQKEAEQIVITTFFKAHQQNIEEQKSPLICIKLIKLIIETAHQQLNNNRGKTNFNIKQFQNTPMLHQIICEQMTFENYCIQNKIAKEQAMKNFKKEFSEILKVKTQSTIIKAEIEILNFVNPTIK